MTGNAYVIRPCAFLVIACALFTGCSTTSRHPWIENGERIGTIWKNKTAYGAECRYLNTAGQLQRVEKRGQDGTLLPGASVTTFIYDHGGELVEEINCDASDTPTVCGEAYVFKRYSYSVGDEGDRVVVQAFLDKERKPVCNTNGYAVAKLVHDGSITKVKEVILENENNEPASGLWDGVNGVSRVKYTVLEGIGDVRCGVYYGPSGMIVGRKQVDGSCYYHTKQTTTRYHNRY